MRPRAEHACLAAGWVTVVAFVVVGGGWSSDPGGFLGSLLFAWILGVMLWCAFGVIRHADHLAEALGEPLGTLILSIVAIEVGLISAVMLGGGSSPTVGRDTMFAVMMIVLNGMIGLCLLIGGLRHHEQTYSLPGATAYLGVIIPLTTIALALPSVTTSSPEGTLTTGQAIAPRCSPSRCTGCSSRSRPAATGSSSPARRAPPWPGANPPPIGASRPIALTLVLSLLTFSGPRTTVLEGAVHLLVFMVWVVLIFSP